MSTIVGTVSLSCNVSYNSAIYSSEDGVLSLVTEDGAFILHGDARPFDKLKPFNVCISKLTQPALFQPAKHLKISYSKHKVTNEKTEFLFDRTLNSNNGKFPLNGPKQARWSSLGVDPNGGSVLAILGHDHRLGVYSNTSQATWTKVSDISELWEVQLENLSQDVKLDDMDSKTFCQLRHDCYTNAAVAISWSSIFQDLGGSSGGAIESLAARSTKRLKLNSAIPKLLLPASSFTVLAVALQSGHIVIWRAQLPVRDPGCFRVLTIIDSGDVLPRSVSVFVRENTAYVCQGNTNGTAAIHTLHIASSQHIDDKTTTCLWDETDRLAVNEFLWLEKDKVLIAIKENYVCLWCLEFNADGTLVIGTSTTQIVNTAILVCNVVCANDKIYLSTINGTIFIGSLNVSELRVELSPLPLPWDIKSWRNNGIIISPNSVYLITAISPQTYHCNTTLKDSLKVHWLQLKSTDEIATCVLSHQGLLSSVSDALVFLRYMIAQGSIWPQTIQDFVARKDNCTALSPYHLKLLRFLMQLHILHLPNDTVVDTKTSLENELLCIENDIIHRHVLASILSAVSTDLNSLSTIERHTLSLMCEWLDSKHSGCDDTLSISSDIKSAVAKVKAVLPITPELCVVCQSNVKITSPATGSCENGHAFARCCQTLILCQEIPYRVCHFCSTLALNKTTNPDCGRVFKSLQTERCTYCDGKMM